MINTVLHLLKGDQEDGDEDRQVKSVLQQQASLVKQQDEQLVLISGSVGTLKSMSRRIGNELDEQALWVKIIAVNLCDLVYYLCFWIFKYLN